MQETIKHGCRGAATSLNNGPHTFEEVMKKRLLAALLLVSFASAPMAADDMRIEVFPVNGDANAVLDVLHPLVPKPGSINAYDRRLVSKSTEHNIEQVRAVLAKLDHRAIYETAGWGPGKSRLVSTNRHQRNPRSIWSRFAAHLASGTLNG